MSQPQAITLNQGQTEAAEAFFQSLFSDEREFIISGPPGVGKTHLMGYIIDIIMPQYLKTCAMMDIEPKYRYIAMTATTNKAAQVLSESTNRPTETIHSYLGLKVQEDYKTGRTKLTKTGAWTVRQNMVIFIDESSMIDSDLYQIIREGFCNCKIVYVGDHCQLSPIMEKISPVFLQGSPMYELTEPMRNSGQPALISLCDQLRKTVETGRFNPILIVPGVIDHVSRKQMPGLIQQELIQATGRSRILSFTNDMVMGYNQEVRNMRTLPNHFTPGEVLVNNNAMMLSNGKISVEEEVTIHAAAPSTEMITISKDVELEVRRCTIGTRFGTFAAMPVPENKDHFIKLVKWYAGNKNWERYFYMKKTFPDLRERDSATVHKAQGSTYDSVFIDLTDISRCHQPDTVARMLNVAVSRARSHVYLYGTLADKYGGLIY